MDPTSNQQAVSTPQTGATQAFPIVGVGASAGGLEALEQFFRHVPAKSGLAFVVVQHLSPDFPSVMDELLSKVTDIPIEVINDGTVVQPDHIYMLPPKQEVILSNGKLLLTERARESDQNFPIDHFYRSLAQDAGERGVAVVLSGTGTDGSRGVIEVHDAGGLVLAQTAKTAKFGGMPLAADETGVVRLALAPEEMPQAILDITSSVLGTNSHGETGLPTTLEGPIYTIFHLLKKKCGVDFADYKTTTISRRVQRRINLTGIEDLAAYTDVLRDRPDEVERLYRDLLIGVTGFFRDREFFDRLETEVIPELMGRLKAEEELRVWCVATATGEEAYSLAILISEFMKRENVQRPVRIFASDIHRESLATAGRGMYPAEALEGISPERIQEFFQYRSDGYYVSPELRKMVVFVPHNVIKDAPFTRIDLVTCRNMLIYLTPPAQRKVMSLFHFALKRESVLCLGPSETIGDLADEFTVIDERAKIFKKRREIPLPPSLRLPMSIPTLPTRSNVPLAVSALSNVIPVRELITTYDELLDDFMPASVLIDGKRSMLHTFGGASAFLRHREGRMSNDILENVHTGLRNPLAAAIRKVGTERTPVVVTGLSVDPEVSPYVINLEVRPVGDMDSPDTRYVVCFRTLEKSPTIEIQQVDGSSYPSEQIETLEHELQHTRDSLQAMIEELQTTNEEMQSTNEQLISSNEELQSTNEELHSVNEELYTVNAEHQRKIDELTELTDDMDNLLNSTNVHTIFVDSELRIRRFTPGVAGTFNLIPQDVGRRIDSFTYNILDDNLVYKIKHVLETGEPLEREVRDRGDDWYLLRILPYLSRGRIDGIVITLIGISALKQTERRLAEISEIVEHSDDAILRVSIDGTITTWNRGAERLFGYPAEEIVGGNVSQLIPEDLKGDFGRDVSRLRKGTSIELVETKRRLRDGRIIEVALSASPICDEDGVVVGASEIVRDITLHKQAEREIRAAVRQRDQFLAMLSHELRNPLAAVANATSLMAEEEVPDDAISEAREVIANNVRHVARMLDDLLDLSRFTHDKMTMQLSLVSLNSLTLDVIECVQHLADEKKQTIHVDVMNDPLYVEGDIGRLQQVQVNLLVNACRYTPSGGRIDYRLYRDGEEAVICISDNGPGIPPDLKERIFEPFVQAEQPLVRAEGGMGLGLPLVRMIVNLHGGTISLHDNAPGSEFSVRIPLTTKRPETKPERRPADVCGKKLLIVEDNPSIRRMLVQSMKLKGFEVSSAENGSEGIDECVTFLPDIAIIDIGLPDVDGYELASAIRERPETRDIFLVAVTGYGRDSDRERATDAGFDLHLVKPIDPNEVLHAISEWLAAHSQELSISTD